MWINIVTRNSDPLVLVKILQKKIKDKKMHGSKRYLQSHFLQNVSPNPSQNLATKPF
jgi:hypothetical protein